MIKTSSKFILIALSREVVITSLKVSLVVGTLLALINHSTAIFHLSLTIGKIYQIALTYLVPYCVSTYSSVKAIQNSTGTNI
jgi:hypothetical protein